MKCCFSNIYSNDSSENQKILQRIKERIQIVQECLQALEDKLNLFKYSKNESKPWFRHYLNAKGYLVRKKAGYESLLIGKTRSIYNPYYWVKNKMLNFKLQTCFENIQNEDFFSQKFLRSVEMTSTDFEGKQKIKYLLKEKFNINLNFKSHSLPINCLDVSIDQKFILTGSDDYTVKLWKYKTFEIIYTFFKHKRDVTAVIFKRKLLSIISSSFDGCIFFYGFDGKVTDKIKTGVKIFSMNLSKNDDFLIISGLDLFIRVLSLSDKSIKTIPLNSDVRSVHLSESDRKIVYTSCLNVFVIFDLHENTVIKELKEKNLTSYCARFSHDESFIVAGGTDGRIMIYYLGSNEVVSLVGHSTCVLDVDISKDELFVVSAGVGNVFIWSIFQKLKIKDFGLGPDKIRCLKFVKNSSSIVAGDSEYLANIFCEGSVKWGDYEMVIDYVVSSSLDLLCTRKRNNFAIWNISKRKKMFEMIWIDKIISITRVVSGKFIVISCERSFIIFANNK